MTHRMIALASLSMLPLLGGCLNSSDSKVAVTTLPPVQVAMSTPKIMTDASPTTLPPRADDWFTPYVGQTRETGTSAGVSCVGWKGADACLTTERFTFFRKDGVPMVHIDFANGQSPHAAIPNYDGPWSKSADVIVERDESGGVKFVFGKERRFEQVSLTGDVITGKLIFTLDGWRDITFDFVGKET